MSSTPRVAAPARRARPAPVRGRERVVAARQSPLPPRRILHMRSPFSYCLSPLFSRGGPSPRSRRSTCGGPYAPRRFATFDVRRSTFVSLLQIRWVGRKHRELDRESSIVHL